MRFIAAFLLTGIAVPAHAVLIPFGLFGSGATIESFENPVAGPNLTFDSNFFSPNVLGGGYDFGSGVSLITPDPNPGTGGAGGVLIGNPDDGATFPLFTNGAVSDSGFVPNGAFYMVYNGVNSLIEFEFDVGMLRVGAFVTADPNQDIILTVYDKDRNVLESQMVDDVNVSDWDSNFLGIQSASANIRFAEFSNADFIVLDTLTFETPEPSVSWLFGVLALSMVVRSRSGVSRA